MIPKSWCSICPERHRNQVQGNSILLDSTTSVLQRMRERVCLCQRIRGKPERIIAFWPHTCNLRKVHYQTIPPNFTIQNTPPLGLVPCPSLLPKPSGQTHPPPLPHPKPPTTCPPTPKKLVAISSLVPSSLQVGRLIDRERKRKRDGLQAMSLALELPCSQIGSRYEVKELTISMASSMKLQQIHSCWSMEWPAVDPALTGSKRVQVYEDGIVCGRATPV